MLICGGFLHPLREYRLAHVPNGWKGWWGGSRFWRNAFPDLVRRSWQFHLNISLNVVWLEIWL
jgi:hypothetical protein